MPDFNRVEHQLSEFLQLDQRPVAIAFRDVPPPAVAKFTGTEPSGCSFWRLAGRGRVFYTVPSDHYNCPIGSYTHNIPLSADRAHELDDILGFMTHIGYVRMEEVPGIPRLARTPEVIIYAPLGKTPVDPDVVLFWGRPGKLMFLQEAAIRAGVSGQLNTLPRPTCMALPAALTLGIVGSTACIGNRVYTDIEDSDLYVAIRGVDLPRIVAEAQTIATANANLLQYHRERREALATE
jgi:uncharacterized protein (DUF169 family)